jgi:hypothetical protein
VVADFKQCSSPCGTFSKVGGVSELRSLQAYAGGESLMRMRVRTCSEMSASRVIGDRVAPLLKVQTVGDGITLKFARSCNQLAVT